MLSSSDESDNDNYPVPETQPTQHHQPQSSRLSDSDDSTSSEGEYDNFFDPATSGDMSASSTASTANDANLYEPVPKKMKSEWSKSYSDKAMNLMKKMGFDGSKGLGKRGQGRLEPIQASEQKGRRGLGLRLDDLSNAAAQWEQTREEVNIPEKFKWLRNNDPPEYLDNLTMEDLSCWVVNGPKKLTIEDETRFCASDILEDVLKSKSAFDKISKPAMRDARTRSNPFETIRSSIFLNRAAVKMANMDSMCDFMFTNPVDMDGNSLIKDNDLLYFADVCAGPGGFSEYVLYKKQWEAKGFGFTLRGKNDFKLDKFYAGSAETFDPYYGIKDDGDIFDTDNQETFQDYVLKQSDNGVHFVMADGGFSVEGEENIQEILSKQLYLCQCLVALSILREKGHFVCKLFDLFTPFSVGLVYLMYKCFEEITICKPNTSRPANSERYLICKWKKPNTDTIQRHMKQVNIDLNDNQISKSNSDVVELVNCEVLFEDKEFIEYITETNNEIGNNQITGLIKIAAFFQDEDLKEENQETIRKQCLALWGLPDEMRKEPKVTSNECLLAELLLNYKDDETFLTKPPTLMKSSSELEKMFKSIHEWYFVPVGRDESIHHVKTLFLCKGKNNILKCNPYGKWENIECYIEISPKTLFYGEIVTELIGEGRSQNKITAIHIIDGLVLGGKDIRRYSLKERLRWCDKFARSLNKPYKLVSSLDGNQMLMAPLRCKKLYPMKDFNKFFDEMRHYKLKERGNLRLGLRIRPDDSKAERFYVPGGLMFFTEINPPYTMSFSRSAQKYYYFNYLNKSSFFIDAELPQEASTLFTSFRGAFYQRLFWNWTQIFQVEQNVKPDQREDGILYRDDIKDFIDRRLNY